MSTSDPGSTILEGISESVVEEFRQARAERVRSNTPISYWCKWFAGLKYSPRQFYAVVEQKVRECEIPDLDPELIVFKQSGFLSARRLYLRFTREKLVFEICAAPFGSGFFVSSRLFDRRLEARWFHYLLALVLWVVATSAADYVMGRVWGIVIFTGIIALAWSLMRLASVDAVQWLSRKLPYAPVIGRIYESWFHPNTYFRQDTNECYRTAIHGVVLSAIDEMTTQQGFRPLTEQERQPWLAGR